MEKKTVLFKALLFIVFLPLSLFSQDININDVNSLEKLRASQQLFIIQDDKQIVSEKVPLFAYYLEDNIFQSQVKNIYAEVIGGIDGNFNNCFGHAPKLRWVSPFCRSPQFP